MLFFFWEMKIMLRKLCNCLTFRIFYVFFRSYDSHALINFYINFPGIFLFSFIAIHTSAWWFCVLSVVERKKIFFLAFYFAPSFLLPSILYLYTYINIRSRTQRARWWQPKIQEYKNHCFGIFIYCDDEKRQQQANAMAWLDAAKITHFDKSAAEPKQKIPFIQRRAKCTPNSVYV